MTIEADFDALRLEAASRFAQTMLIVDDQAGEVSEQERTGAASLNRPNRRDAARAEEADRSGRSETADIEHALDAKSLVDKALEVGLMCSVVKPASGESFRDRIVKASEIADIICLDWEIFGDGGTAAAAVIKEIIRKDAQEGGRLRLLAIYTGDTSNQEILDRVLTEIPIEVRQEQKFVQDGLEISSAYGTRIVCLFKTHGRTLMEPASRNQVAEAELPERLRKEFAKLSEGLLSNVALVTIGEIRRGSHHVLARFSGLDGPYFHHRASIETPEDAEEYAVDVVMSELKTLVDKVDVGSTQAGAASIRERITELSGEADTMTLRFQKDKEAASYEVPVDLALKMVLDGVGKVLREDGARLVGKPGKDVIRENLTSLFCENDETARLQMHRFAALTGVRADPFRYADRRIALTPKLGLGTVLRDPRGQYLMCLQASCDAVRIRETGSFLFVPLEIDEREPEHVVPVDEAGTNSPSYVGLRMSRQSYRVVRSIPFSSTNSAGTVNARIVEDAGDVCFSDTEENRYVWIADLKRSRALRAVQWLSQQMGRLGFDEFEPYRRRQS